MEIIETGTSDSRSFEPLVDSRAAGAMLHYNHKTVERKARARELPAYQIGTRWFFRASELDVWVRSKLNSAIQSRRVN